MAEKFVIKHPTKDRFYSKDCGWNKHKHNGNVFVFEPQMAERIKSLSLLDELSEEKPFENLFANVLERVYFFKN